MKRLIALCGGTLMVLALSASAAQAQNRRVPPPGPAGQPGHPTQPGYVPGHPGMPREARLGPRGQLKYPHMPWYYQVHPLEFHYGARVDRVHCALRGDWDCHARLGGLTWDVDGDGDIDEDDRLN